MEIDYGRLDALESILGGRAAIAQAYLEGKSYGPPDSVEVASPGSGAGPLVTPTVLLDTYYDSAIYLDKAAAIQTAINAVQTLVNGGVLECRAGRVHSGMVRSLRFARNKPCRIRMNGATFQADPAWDVTTAGYQLFGFNYAANPNDYNTYQDCVIEHGTLDLNGVVALSGFANANGDNGAKRANILRCGFGDDVSVINGTSGAGSLSNAGLSFSSNHANADWVPTASPQVFQNANGLGGSGWADVSLDVTVSGGTVSDISTSPDNSTWTTVGITSGTFTVAAGIYVRITYTVAPTVRTQEHTRTTVTDCFVGERFRCVGPNNGIVAGGASKNTITQTQSGVNVITDRFRVSRGWYCDQSPSAPQTSAYGVNIQFGGYAHSRDCYVGRGLGLNASDEGVAILNGVGCVVDNVTVQDARDCSFQALNLKAVLLEAHPLQVTFINPIARYVNTYPKQYTGAGLPFQIGGFAGGGGGTSSIATSGGLVFINPTVKIESAWPLLTNSTTTPYLNHGAFFYADGGFEHIAIVGELNVEIAAVNWTGSATTQTSLIGMWVRCQSGASVSLGKLRINFAGGTWADDGTHSLTIIPLHVSGDSVPRVNVDEITVSYSVTNTGAVPPTIVPVALGSTVTTSSSSALASVTGGVRNVRMRGDQHSRLTAVTGVSFATATTAKRFVIDTVDVSETQLGSNAVAVNTAPYGVRLLNISPRKSPYAPTILTGIDDFTNTDRVRERFTVIGGTVSKIEIVSPAHLEAVLNLPGLAGYWPFTEKTGTAAVEASGLAANGIYDSSVVLRQAILANQVRGVAPNFPGADTHSKVDLGAAFDFVGSLPFTVMAWVIPSALSGTQFIVCNTGGTAPGGWALWANGTTLTWSRYDSAGVASALGAGTLANGTPALIAGVYMGGTTNNFASYINGVRVAIGSTSRVLASSGNHAFVGSAPNGGAAFKGNAGHVKICSAALTTAQILAIYNAGVGADGNTGLTAGSLSLEPDEAPRISSSVAPTLAVVPG